MRDNKIIILRVLCGGIFFFAADQARAFTCTTITPLTVITPPSISVQRDLPVNSPIGNELLSDTSETFKCSNTPPPVITSHEYGIKAYGNYVTTINNRRVYQTNIAGIGYAVGLTQISPCNSGKSVYVNGSNPENGGVDAFVACWGPSIFSAPILGQARIQFYKIAHPTGTGTVGARKVGAFILKNNSSWFSPESNINISAFNLTTTACTVDNKTVSVPMGIVKKQAFGGPGTGSGEINTREFIIPLSCDVGTRVNLQIDGNVQNAVDGVLNLSGGAGSASGVGIQLLHNNKPLPLSTIINIGTASNTGNYNIPLKARYYQTSNVITPGVANSSATFTLTYQ